MGVGFACANELFDDFFDVFNLFLARIVLGDKLGLGEVFLEFLPFFLFDRFFVLVEHGFTHFFHFLVGLRRVEVPVKHLLEEVALVQRLLDNSTVVRLFADERDVSDINAQLVRQKLVHLPRVVECIVHIRHQASSL